MVKVLELNKKKYTWGWLREDCNQQTAIQYIFDYCVDFQPKMLVIFGRSLGEQVKSFFIDQGLNKISVFEHPLQLKETPALKKQAYKDLLALKNSLENIK